ncbi:unnamed protein product [Colias eurytheme]|nr:unnamed protein product [Colias eurytheme]
MGSLEDVYIQAGRAEGSIQSGDVSERAKALLRSMPTDVRKVGEQTSLVDLTFLKSGDDRRRVAGIIERVLMIHTENSGISRMTPSEKRGVFRYQVIGTTSSGSSSSSSPLQPPSKIQRLPTQKTPKKPTLERLPELDNGVILSPKFPGLPKCVIRYGRYGITPEMVSKMTCCNMCAIEERRLLCSIQRRNAFLPKEEYQAALLSTTAIPPSTTHLFCETGLAELMKKPFKHHLTIIHPSDSDEDSSGEDEQASVDPLAAGPSRSQNKRKSIPVRLNWQDKSLDYNEADCAFLGDQNIPQEIKNLVTPLQFFLYLHIISRNKESTALELCQDLRRTEILQCGLSNDKEIFFLGASSDGKCEHGIVEIKCPSSAYGMDPEEAIRQKKVDFWKYASNSNQLVVNPKHK